MIIKGFIFWIKKVKFWRRWHSNIQTKDIGEGTVIHSHCWIGDKVTIGKNCKIQAFCFIPTGVKIGNNVFVGPGVVFTNDKHPPSGRDHWAGTVVKDDASIGANATILPGIIISEGAAIGAGAVVTCDVPPGVTVMGVPARVVTHNSQGASHEEHVSQPITSN